MAPCHNILTDWFQNFFARGSSGFLVSGGTKVAPSMSGGAGSAAGKSGNAGVTHSTTGGPIGGTSSGHQQAGGDDEDPRKPRWNKDLPADAPDTAFDAEDVDEEDGQEEDPVEPPSKRRKRVKYERLGPRENGEPTVSLTGVSVLFRCV